MFNIKNTTDKELADLIPHVMGTQHPDNFSRVPFSTSPRVSLLLEDKELLYNIGILPIKELMIDYERKRGDATPLWNWIHQCRSCMEEKVIGQDFHVTPRIPNGDTEKDDPYFWQSMGIFITSLPVMKRMGFSGLAFSEFIVPDIQQGATVVKTERHIQQRYELQLSQYKDYGDGSDFPHMDNFFIQGIPLIETVENLINPEPIWDEMITLRKEWAGVETYVQRSFIARSDPALKAGMLAALIAAAVALEKGRRYEHKTGIRIPQILGIGSAPFRGGITPNSKMIDAVLSSYPGIATVTVQSAFRYDFPEDTVIDACHELNEKISDGWLKRNDESCLIDEIDMKDVSSLIRILKTHYEDSYKELMPLIYRVIPFIPSHRERYADVSIAGESRNVGGLPAVRAIKFAASCYSLGIPPGILGLRAWRELGDQYKSIIDHVCPTFKFWIAQELKWLNTGILDSLKRIEALDYIIKDIETAAALVENWEPEQKHLEVSRQIVNSLEDESKLTDLILQAAAERNFLG